VVEADGRGGGRGRRDGRWLVEEEGGRPEEEGALDRWAPPVGERRERRGEAGRWRAAWAESGAGRGGEEGGEGLGRGVAVWAVGRRKGGEEESGPRLG
jgi:hypothetical protein